MPALLQDFTSQPAHLFICYKRDAADDEQLAHYLHNFLRAQGHDVFIDKSMPAGTSWIEEIDRQLQTSDFLVVLLSPESVESEMVQAEVRRAYDYRKLHERPRTLPIRLAYEGLLPYAIDLFLDPLQYVAWQSRADNERVAEEILAAIQGRLSPQRPIGSGREGERAYPQSMMSGRETPSQKPPTPSGSQDLELPAPSGIAHGIFYMERDVDTDLKRQVAKKGGTLTTIRAPRQTGKTSLLAQGVVQAREHGIQVVNLDLQRVERAYLQTYDGFLRYLAEYIVWELALDIAQVEQSWRGPLGSQDKLSKVLAYVLAESDKPIMLAMDEVDRLLETPFHSDFFALVRAWHNNHAYYEAWKKLNIVMVISTEPHLLIADVNRSPFNVGLKLDLEDFSETQVRHLNQRHGSPVKEEEIPQMMRLLNGHPYLTRQALYTLVTENLTWDNLTPIATSQQGPFGEHLRRYHWLLRNQNKLKAGLKQVIQQGRCPDDNDMTFYRLLRAGLIKGDSSKSCSCRCDLYRIYFEDNL